MGIESILKPLHDHKHLAGATDGWLGPWAAAGRVVLWIEKQHQWFAAQVGEAALHSVLIFGFERRSLIANSDGHRIDP